MNKISMKKKSAISHVYSLEIPTPFPIGPVNAYIIVGEKTTLVDTGPKTDKAWKAFIYQLNKNGFRIKDIDQVIVTHQHVDHSGLVGMIKQHHPTVKLFAHPWTIPWIEKDPLFIEQKATFYRQLFLENGLSYQDIKEIEQFHSFLDQCMDPVKIEGVLVDGERPKGIEDWQVIHSPGHSQGHILLYHEQNQILMAGDHIIGHTSGGAFVEPAIDENVPRPKSVVDYQKSLLKLRELPLKEIYSGHGKVIENPYDVIDKQLRRFEQRKEQLESFLVIGDFSVYELMQLVYPRRYQTHLALYFAEVIGHLDLLEEEGKVTTYKKDQKIKYHLEKRNR